MPGNEPNPAWSRQEPIREEIRQERQRNAERKAQETPQEIAKREVRREAQIIEMSRTPTQPNVKSDMPMAEGEASVKSGKSGMTGNLEATPGDALKTEKPPQPAVDASADAKTA
jgi:hypothetical protein